MDRFSEGSPVRVKSKERILQSAYLAGQQGNGLFMEQMWEYCGKEFKVLKKVNHVFDEYRHTMHETRSPYYILEGLICNGHIRNLDCHCDRSCYFLWHEQWLEESISVKNNDADQSFSDSPEQNCSENSPKNLECSLNCQLTNIRCIADQNSAFNNIFQHTVSMLGKLKGRLLSYCKTWLESPSFKREEKGERMDNELFLQAGDTVRIRTKPEINRILDSENKTGGCGFAKEMYLHCGRVYKVLKPITSFYDEARGKVLKSKNMVILENVTCSGKFKLFPWRCNRTCFYFWRKEWLEKVTNK